LSYSGAPFCHPDPFSLGPDAPDKKYFLAIGFQEAYNKPIANQPGGPAITAGTVRAIALFASAPVIAVATVAAFTIGAPILVASGVAAAVFPYAAAAGTVAGVAAAAVAAVVFFVLIAVVIGIVAAIKVFSPTALDEMNAERTTVYAAPPDLSTYTDSSGLLKMTQTLIQATLPEFTSTDALPTHRDQDGLFIIQPKDGAGTPHLTLTYEDWDGEIRTATLDHGFFLVEHTKDDGTVEKEMTLSIQYVRLERSAVDGLAARGHVREREGRIQSNLHGRRHRLVDRRPPRRRRRKDAGCRSGIRRRSPAPARRGSPSARPTPSRSRPAAARPRSRSRRARRRPA
jgi:hypothetical protein